MRNRFVIRFAHKTSWLVFRFVFRFARTKQYLHAGLVSFCAPPKGAHTKRNEPAPACPAPKPSAKQNAKRYATSVHVAAEVIETTRPTPTSCR